MADLVHQRGQQVDPPRGRRAGRRIEQMIRIAAGELRRIAGRGIDEPARPGRIVVDRDDAVLVGREGIAAELLDLERERRSEEHTSELQSLMRNSYAVFCL